MKSILKNTIKPKAIRNKRNPAINQKIKNQWTKKVVEFEEPEWTKEPNVKGKYKNSIISVVFWVIPCFYRSEKHLKTR